MRIKDIKQFKDVLSYFNTKSVKKVLTELKNSKLSTTTKKALSYKIYKENSNKKILGKKSKEVYESYKVKSKVEKKLIDKYKNKYDLKSKSNIRRVTRKDIQKSRLKHEYVTIKEPGKPSYQVLKNDFATSNKEMKSGVYDNYVFAKVREGTKFRHSTITLTDKELKRIPIQDKFTNFQYIANIAAEQKRKYLNLEKKPEIEIMSISSIYRRV